jgi:GNAT superfamily N-acetyltransferase
MADAATSDVVVRRLPAAEIRERADELAELVIHAARAAAMEEETGAAVRPLDAVGWTLDVADGAGRLRIVLVAELDGEIVGAVQVLRPGTALKPHLAEISELMVHPRERGRGIGRALMRSAEEAALAWGASLLTLGASVNARGRGFYAGLGWRMAGVIPGYVPVRGGREADTAVYYKTIGET